MLEWKEEMSTGIEVLDEQHRELLATIERLSRAIRTRNASVELEDIVSTLDAYADAHFSIEELCMDRYHCPAAEKNQEGHRCFLADLVKVKRELATQGPSDELAEQIHRDLGLWFLNHIQGIDAELRASVAADDEPMEP